MRCESVAIVVLLAVRVASADDPTGEVEATCTQEGAQVMLDGKPWFACPGTRKERLPVGEHAVTGDAPGYAGRQQSVIVTEGTLVHSQVAFDRLLDPEYRWRRWIPWTVVGSGVLVGMTGLLVGYHAGQLQDDYDRIIARDCAVTGCDLSDPQFAELVEKQDAAERDDKIGIVLLLGGAASLATGVVLVLLNHPVGPRGGLGIIRDSP